MTRSRRTQPQNIPCPTNSRRKVSKREIDFVHGRMNRLTILRKYIVMPRSEKHLVLSAHLLLDIALRDFVGHDGTFFVKVNGAEISVLTRVLTGTGGNRRPTVSVSEMDDNGTRDLEATTG